jgi:hypothetical protein
VRKALPEQCEQCQHDAHAHEHCRSGDGDGHETIVAAKALRVVHGSLTSRRRSAHMARGVRSRS